MKTTNNNRFKIEIKYVNNSNPVKEAFQYRDAAENIYFHNVLNNHNNIEYIKMYSSHVLINQFTNLTSGVK
jgi:hypothetical protein